MLTVYGIKNCDTVKKALKWLDANGVEYAFHDLRAEPLSEAKLSDWVAGLGSKKLVNKASTTWRQLDDATRTEVENGNALPALIANPTLIKRPVLEGNKILHVGFKEADYNALLNR